jgi:hypothetical protein
MSPKRDNPYGILILALPFLAGGIILLLKTSPGVVSAFPTWPPWLAPGLVVETASVSMEHAAGALAIAVGVGVIWFYFRIRNQARYNR